MNNSCFGKTIENIENKDRYVVRRINLKLYERLGLKVTKIHRGIKYKQSEWLKPYIELNTKPRTESKNSFEKEFFKLMNNSEFGKTIENIENRVDIKLVTDREKAEKLAAKHNFQHCTIFDESLIAVQMKKTWLYYDSLFTWGCVFST